jgi:hypothetical protein
LNLKPAAKDIFGLNLWIYANLSQNIHLAVECKISKMIEIKIVNFISLHIYKEGNY